LTELVKRVAGEILDSVVENSVFNFSISSWKFFSNDLTISLWNGFIDKETNSP
jgi:hypothetical protein